MLVRISKVLILTLVLSCLSCSAESPSVFILSGKTMGTSYNVKVVPGQRSFDVEMLKALVQRELDELEGLMTTYRSDSEVSRFNVLPVGEVFQFADSVFKVVGSAQDISKQTQGAFDITVGPLVKLWGFGSNGGVVAPPLDKDIELALIRSGFDKLKLNPETQSASKAANVEIDLSAIAKGYAVDRIAALLDAEGVPNYLVEVGGETKAKGLNDKGLIWRLGIEKPDELGRSALAVIEVDGMALATSGDYRNYFVADGKRYSHTIDPSTGKPVEHSLASVSVLAESCMEADALATALLVMGEDRGFQYASERNLNAYFIYRSENQYKIRVTDGFKPYLLQ